MDTNSDPANDADSTGSGSGSTTMSYSPGQVKSRVLYTLPYRTYHDQDQVVSFAAFRCEAPDTGGTGGHDASYPLPADREKVFINLISS